MKKFARCALILMLGTSCSLLAQPTAIRSKSELAQALTQGEHVRAIIHFDRCQTNAPRENEVIGGLEFTQFTMSKAKGAPVESAKIATSHTMLVEHPDDGPIYQYVRIRVFEPTMARVTSMTLHPETKKILKTTDYQCTFSGDTPGVVLFRS